MNLLFICSRNQWRSRTAETIFKDNQSHTVRSAGTAENARIRVTQKLIEWADIIFVMEKIHRHRLHARFGPTLIDKELIILDIPDEYPYMDAELIEMLTRDMSVYLGNEW